MHLRNRKGFTLIEVIVVAAIIAVLAGILVPLIFKEIDESKNSRALADVRAISSAMIVLKKDTGQWPISSSCENTITLLAGAGTQPTFAGAGWSDANAGSYDDRLNRDAVPCWPNTWRGPYMASVNADPWGNQYVTNADGFVAAAPKPSVWIISAGADGIVQTSSADTVIQGDDMGARLQ